MYPRLNPRSNNSKNKLKGSINQINDRFSNYCLKFQNQNKKVMKLEYSLSERRNNLNQDIQQSILASKGEQNLTNQQNKCLHNQLCHRQLPQKYNHLRGKRRSLQMALLLYQKNDQQKFYPLNSTINRSLSRSTSKNQSQSFIYKKQSRMQSVKNKQNEKQFIESNKKIRSYLSNILVENNANINISTKLNQFQNENNQLYAYNFIQRPIKKKSFFKTKIMESILKNSIDQWDNHNQEENQQTVEFTLDQK